MTENVPDPARPPRPRHIVDGDDFEADLDDDPPAAVPGSGSMPEPGTADPAVESERAAPATVGARILANKVVYDFRDPAQGDVVVFAGPPSWVPETRIAEPTSWIGSALQSLGSVVGIAPPNEKDYVKRVIAVGGQTVQCCDAQGAVTVDGRSLVEPYIYEPIEFVPGELDCSSSPTSRRCFGPVTIPAGQLWVMGDHRSDSADSSYQCQGFAPGSGAQCHGRGPVENVIGKAVFIVM